MTDIHPLCERLRFLAVWNDGEVWKDQGGDGQRWKASEIIIEAAATLEQQATALLTILAAVRDYLPGKISAQDCLSRVIGAIDNAGVNEVIDGLPVERGEG